MGLYDLIKVITALILVSKTLQNKVLKILLSIFCVTYPEALNKARLLYVFRTPIDSV